MIPSFRFTLNCFIWYKPTITTITFVLQDNGIQIRSPAKSNTKISPEQLDEITKRHQNGETLLKLANEYGVSDSAIERALVKKGADILFFPSKIRYEGIKPWHMYVQVRALEKTEYQ